MTLDRDFIGDLQSLKAKIKDNWSLCKLMADHGNRASEKEYMIAETIHAACINFSERGEPFSYRGDGVLASDGSGLFDNRTAYGYLVNQGYFIEEKRGDKLVIFPTRKLLDLLKRFFEKG